MVSNEDILKTLTDVHTEVKLTNGRVTIVEEKLGEHECKFEQLGLTESFKKGYRKGKLSMKTNTRNTVLLFIAIAGIILAATAYGTRQIRHFKSDQVSSLKHQLEQATDYYRHENPTTEGLPPWNKLDES